jgi:hypothetical protein
MDTYINKMSIPIREFLKPFQVARTNIYSIPPDVFQQLDIKTWRYNRPPSNERVAEIREWNVQFGRMDGVLNLAYIPGTGMVCFEGNHRRLALGGLNVQVLVDILWDVSDETVMYEFRRINKSVSVPELYVAETEVTLKLEVEALVTSFRKKYPTHETASGRPQRPNFNRDGLTDQLTRIQQETCITVSELEKRLIELNERYSRQDTSKLSQKIVEKCQSSGMWLFAWSSSLSSKDFTH